MSNKLGFIYRTSHINNIVNAGNLNYSSSYSDHKLVGLSFGVYNQSLPILRSPRTITAKEIYFNINDVSFLEKDSPLLYVNNEHWVLPTATPAVQDRFSGPNISSDIRNHLEFNDPSHPFVFSFFSIKQLQIISAISTEIILSGSRYNPGSVVNPDSSGASMFTNLQFEVDVNKITNNFQNGGTTCLPMPFIISGTPCPPLWNSNCIPDILMQVSNDHITSDPHGEGGINAAMIHDLQCSWSKFASRLYKPTGLINRESHDGKKLNIIGLTPNP